MFTWTHGAPHLHDIHVRLRQERIETQGDVCSTIGDDEPAAVGVAVIAGAEVVVVVAVVVVVVLEDGAGIVAAAGIVAEAAGLALSYK